MLADVSLNLGHSWAPFVEENSSSLEYVKCENIVWILRIIDHSDRMSIQYWWSCRLLQSSHISRMIKTNTTPWSALFAYLRKYLVTQGVHKVYTGPEKRKLSQWNIYLWLSFASPRSKCSKCTLFNQSTIPPNMWMRPCVTRTGDLPAGFDLVNSKCKWFKN